jgi:omega-amidase
LELGSLLLFTFLSQFGEVLAAAGHEEATVVGDIDLSLIEAVRYIRFFSGSFSACVGVAFVLSVMENLCRENLPLEMQRRRDMYRLIDVQKESYAS